MTETNEKKKEREGIALAIFSDWKGARTERGIGIEGTVVVDTDQDIDVRLAEIRAAVSSNTVVSVDRIKRTIKIKQPFRFDVSLPLPTNDADAQALYSKSQTELVTDGVTKHSYDRDTNLGNMITESILNGVDFKNIEDVSNFELAFEEELSTVKEKTTSTAKVNQAKASQLTNLMAKYKVASVEELMALIDKK